MSLIINTEPIVYHRTLMDIRSVLWNDLPYLMKIAFGLWMASAASSDNLPTVLSILEWKKAL